MNQPNQPEQDAAVNALHRLGASTFGDLLATVDQIGANKGHRQVIDIYRTWIAPRGAGGPLAHAAWFNLGAEWNHAGEPDNAILACRTALAPRPGFIPAAINLGLLLERRGESFASRMAGRLPRAIGATSGITESLESYTETAVALATLPELLSRYRSVFTETNPAATIGDIATFTYHYEETLIQIERANRTRATEEPEPIAEAAMDMVLDEAVAA